MIEPKQIINERDAGYMRIAYVSHWNEALSETVNRFGLEHHERLVRIDREKAAAIIAALLSKDMAYRRPLKSTSSAPSYAEGLLANFPETASTFYTNAFWDEYFQSSSFSFSGVIDSATFDGGVIAVTAGVALCVWFEDED
jgi:hypothetical protein